ncbi:MAG TPA: MBL fold metallo-hydrolase [Burkholderiaceae bacterium]|jgi:glyoxylase-like metal-dependent hydrolase (beta-lactamase superfamily II)/8-oxo-dGTP pyrophosphatase MutT (NUDIX family)
MSATPAAAPTTPPVAATPRAAATLIVLRDAPRGLEVLMLRRAERPGDQNSGAAVFPGGLLDQSDGTHHALCDGLDDAAASARLNLPANGLDYWINAIRECFEEAGLLFARDANGAFADLSRLGADEVFALRDALHSNRLGLDAVCARLGVRLSAQSLAYYSHWITPLGLPKIFDTRFFIAESPANQTTLADGGESVELLWLTPAEALDKARALKLMHVTAVTLKHLAGFTTAAQAIAAARAQGAIAVTRPRLATGPKGRQPVDRGAWAFAEIGRLDPEGRGHVSTELLPGRPVWLSPRVLRVTAPNGSLMTGPGTNSYFIGAPGSDAWALLDPGPDDAAHLQALREAAPGKVTRILVTHTHKDHSPAAAPLAAEWGVPTFGLVANSPEWQDTGFVPTQTLHGGERIVLGEGVSLRVLHTPGHASNHLCYLLEQEKLLFTGDHLMQGSTVVINPPDGDMVAYLASLNALLGEDLAWLAPGHGFLIDAPHEVVRKTIAHRLAREAKVLAAVTAHGPADAATLLPIVYADTSDKLHGVALRSLQAHLHKLHRDQAVTLDAQARYSLSRRLSP